MIIPKKKYRDKVRERLAKVKELFVDRNRTMVLLTRLGISGKPEVSNALEAMDLLLDRDVPALLDALDAAHEPLRQLEQPVEVEPGDFHETL